MQITNKFQKSIMQITNRNVQIANNNQNSKSQTAYYA